MNIPEVNLTSLGRLAVDLQIAPARLEKIIARMELKPTLILNGIPHYDLAAIGKVYAARRRQTNPHSIAEM